MKISAAQYSKSLYELTMGKPESEIDGIAANLVKILAKNNQLKLADKIIDKFSGIYNKENGIVEVEAVTARKLESSQIHKVENYIKEKYKAKKVVLKNIIDEKIKGGIIVKVGDEVMDGSVARQLQDLKTRLSK